MITKAQARLQAKACRLLGIARSLLVDAEGWRALTGHNPSPRGQAKTQPPCAVFVPSRGTSATLEIHVHELLHVLFPSRAHWWITAAALKLTTGKLRYCYGRWCFPSDVPESRAALLRLAHVAAKRKGL
jgi:hypothetical protein